MVDVVTAKLKEWGLENLIIEIFEGKNTKRIFSCIKCV